MVDEKSVDGHVRASHFFLIMQYNYRYTWFDIFAGTWWYQYSLCIFWVEQKRRHKITSLDVSTLAPKVVFLCSLVWSSNSGEYTPSSATSGDNCFFIFNFCVCFYDTVQFSLMKSVILALWYPFTISYHSSCIHKQSNYYVIVMQHQIRWKFQLCKTKVIDFDNFGVCWFSGTL